MRGLIILAAFLLLPQFCPGQSRKRAESPGEREDSYGQRRQSREDPSRAMICAGESALRAAAAAVLRAKDPTLIEWGHDEGRQHFSSRKWRKDVFRLLFSPSEGPGRTAGCFDVRLDRARGIFFNDPPPGEVYCVQINYRTDCFTYRVWKPADEPVVDRRPMRGSKQLDEWLIEIKNRAEDRRASPSASPAVNRPKDMK